ncbi:uncharacterized protein LOC134245369, partial [Saccostrea cucullata]|uniref:uncharacterized protein LOC134245369 n=1 Tax=Saccostrea cuccullata TaxID=36930 RepID=UPI002ED207E9
MPDSPKTVRFECTEQIILPTGTKVLILDGWVIRGSQFINVKIVASTADYNNTEGLCGTFDGDKTNELTTRQGTIYRGASRKPNEFSLSWRVPVDESLYQGYCGTVDSTFEIKSYCDCMEGQTAMCQEGMDLMYCVEIEKRRGLLGGKRGIKRLTPDLVRDAESPPSRCTTDQPPEEFEYDPEYKSPDPLTNITEPDAKKICEDFMKSKEAGKECMEVPGLDVTPIVQGCIADLQITGDTDWAKESLDNLQEECKVIVEGSNTTNITNIIGLICPNSCFDNGNCKE